MLFAIASGTLFITFLLNGVLFFISYESEAENKTLKSIFRLHVASIAMWAFFVFLLLQHAAQNNFPVYYSGDSGYMLAQIVFAAATVLFSTNYWFVQYFIWGAFIKSPLNYAIITLQSGTLLLSVLNNTLYGNVYVEPAGYVSLEILPLNAVYSIFLLAHLVIPLLLLFQFRYKEKSERKRKQYQILFISYLLFLIASMTFNWVLPVYFDVFNFNAYGPTTSLILVAGIAYAIMRYRFLDIRVIIQRGLIYTALFVVIIAVYVSFIQVLGLVFQLTTQVTAFLSAGITTIVGIFTVPHIEKYFRRITDSIFFKDKYDYGDALHKLSEQIHRDIGLRAVIDHTKRNLIEILKVESVDIVFSRDKTSAGENEESVHSVPLKSKDVVIGSIELGPKLSGDPYSDEDLRLLRTFGYHVAVALERARLYEEVQSHSKNLEKLVAERTEKLHVAQAQQRQIITEISHGLQTPLTTIRNQIDFLKRYVPEREQINAFSRSIEEVSKFAYDLLRLSRLENQVNTAQMQDIDLSTLLEELITYFSISAKDQQIEITHAVAKHISIKGVYKEFEEGIINVLTNAVKYLGSSKKRMIRISLTYSDQMATIQISDTGVGIPPDDIESIFTRFYRSEQNTDGISGSGLGLAITKAIIDKHGGTIAVESVVNEGSTFTIKMPASCTEKY